MRTFTDNAGRSWTVAITIGSAKRVRDLAGVDLLDLQAGDPPLLARLGFDIALVCDVVYAVVQPQAEEREVSDREFGEALGGGAALAAQMALCEDLADFFRGLGRTDQATALEAQGRTVRAAVARASQKIESLEAEAGAAFEARLAEIDTIRGGSSGDSPGSSASTPAP